MIDSFVALLPNLVVAAVVVLAFVMGARIARKFAVRTARHYNRTEHPGQIVGRLLQWIIFGTGLLVALSVVAPSFQLKDLVSTLGIGGLAVGFAFRDVFQNFLAGLILLVTQPFHIGDQIKVKDFEGTVDEIETRATIIRTYDGRRVVIPNSTLFTEALSVNTTFDTSDPSTRSTSSPERISNGCAKNFWTRFKLFPTFCMIRRQRCW